MMSSMPKNPLLAQLDAWKAALAARPKTWLDKVASIRVNPDSLDDIKAMLAPQAALPNDPPPAYAGIRIDINPWLAREAITLHDRHGRAIGMLDFKTGKGFKFNAGSET